MINPGPFHPRRCNGRCKPALIPRELASRSRAPAGRRFACYSLRNDSKGLESEMATQTAQNPLREKMLKGLAYQKAGEIEKAQRCYKQVLKKLPQNADVLHLLGVTYRQLGQPRRAIEYIQKAIKFDSKQAPFFANLARAMMDIGTDSDSMLAVTEKALSLNPNEREALNMKAIALTSLKRFDEAEVICKDLISRDPNYSDAYTNYGVLLRKSKRSAEAIDYFDKAQRLAPFNPKIHVERARCRLELKDFDTAVPEIEAALERFPDNADLKHEKARLMFSVSRTHDGVKFAEEAVDAKPDDYHCRVTLGVTYLMLGRGHDAIRTLNKAKELAPDGAVSGLDWNLSLAHLSVGNLEEGWDLHEARFADQLATSRSREFAQPTWRGEDISDKTVLVWGDQGLGDAVKSATMLPDLAAISKKIILEVSEKSIPLFRQSFPDIEVREAKPDAEIHKAPEAADYDVVANITDLAGHFRRSVEAFKTAKYPAYTFNRDRALAYLDRLPDTNDKPVIGISWRSRNLAKSRARYYLSAPDFSPVLDAEDAIFVNLQYKALQRELDYMTARSQGRFYHFEDVDLFDDLVAAADLTAICDLVISANTSVADTAGILGVPCVRFGPVEPPLLLGEPSPPWYPSMKYVYIDETKTTAEIVPAIIEAMRCELKAVYPDARKVRLGQP